METIQLIQALEHAPLLAWAAVLGVAACVAAWRAHVRARQSPQLRRAVAVARRPTGINRRRRW